ncbi:MAG: hypothetical protein ACK5V3_05910, partial [Bdellovibrionales bacterium]
PQDQIRVLQSVTDSDSTLIVVVAHKSRQLTFQIESPTAENKAEFNSSKIDFKLTDFLIYQLHIKSLVPGNDYILKISDSQSGRTHQKIFHSLPEDFTKIKWGFLTCSSHRRAGPQRSMFQKLKSENLDALIFAGDLVYANSALDTGLGRPATPEQAVAIYVKTIFELDLYNFERLVPIFSTWDDHDMAMNNATEDHPYLELVTKIFRAFYPADSRIRTISEGPGVAFSMKFKNFKLIFADSRSFYNPDAKTLLGGRQLVWMLNELHGAGSISALVSSIQFLDYGRLAENVSESAPWEWERITEWMRNSINPTLLFSGDVHYSQIQKLDQKSHGINSFEITSSAMFSLSSGFFGKRGEDQGQLAYYGFPNFLVFQNIKIEERTCEMQIKCVSEKNDQQFLKQVILKT